MHFVWGMCLRSTRHEACDWALSSCWQVGSPLFLESRSLPLNIFHVKTRLVTGCCSMQCVIRLLYIPIYVIIQTWCADSCVDLCPHRRRRSAILSTLTFRANEVYVTVQPANGQEDTIRDLTVSVHAYNMHGQFCKTDRTCTSSMHAVWATATECFI